MKSAYFFSLSPLFPVILGCLLFSASCKKDNPKPLPPGEEIGCNGHAELCEKAYNEVVFATTHNAFNYESGPISFLFPNQNFPITDQLEYGIRGFMIDVHPYDGSDPAEVDKPYVYHNFSVLGSQPLTGTLTEIKDFLEVNPNEIVSIILECYVESNQIAWAMEDAGLLPYLHSQPEGEAWPTLQQMIDDSTRLVVFSDKDDAGFLAWYHYVWDYAVETNWSNNSRGDFSCDFNRGEPENDLFIVNHFVTDATIGIGLPDSASLLNALPYIEDRVTQCQYETGKVANFLTVDFYANGDVMEAVDRLNGIEVE
jgi:hypothetical protein